jgi:hypothetical protein
MDLLQEITVADRMFTDEREWVDVQAAKTAVVQFIAKNFVEFVKSYDNNAGVIRTADGCYKTKENYWGKLLLQADDPLGYESLKNDEFSNLVLRPGLPRIPSNLWGAWTALCFHFVENSIRSNLEVSVRILQNEADETQFKIIVPRQEVTAASVRIKDFEDAVDLLTGEPIVSYPIPGWRSFGSSHSHNTMQAFASAVDDKYELGDPGFHVIVGGIDTKKKKYHLFASVTSGKVRYKIPHDSLIDITPDHTKFHPDVLNYITVETFKPYVPGSVTWSGGANRDYNKSWQNQQGKWVRDQSNKIAKTRYSPWDNKDHDMIDDYCDPFYWESDGRWNTEMTANIDPNEDMDRAKNAIDRIWDIYMAHQELGNQEVLNYIEQHIDFLTDQIILNQSDELTEDNIQAEETNLIHF